MDVGCTPCAERRRMIQEARSQGPAAIVRSIPQIAKHFIQKPPVIRRKTLPQPPIQREG